MYIPGAIVHISCSYLLDDVSPLCLCPRREREVFDSARVTGGLQKDCQHPTQRLEETSHMKKATEQQEGN